jgi:hypothetical protein
MTQAISDPMADYEVAAPRAKYRLRFSLLALLIFFTLVSIALAWLVQPNRVVVTALFEVESSERKLMGDASYDEREFEIFKKTQLAKINSYYVLQAAVRNPAVAALPVFQNRPDPVTWLQENIEVDFPLDGEIMAIRLRGPEAQAKDLVRIVDEVAKAYEDEVVFADAQTQLATRDLKAASLTKLRNELLKKTKDLINLKKELGATAAESAEVQAWQTEIEVLTEVVREISRSLEFSDIEATGPPRIRKVQPAVPSPDN